MSPENLNKLKRDYEILGKALTKKNQRWKDFADNFIESGNAAEAYVNANYNPRDQKTARKSANKLRTKADIKAYISAKTRYIQARDEDRKIAKATEVLEFYTRVLRDEEEEEIVVSTAEDVWREKKKPSIRDKVAAAKELLKRYPEVDPVEQAKLRKLIADARTSEAKATIAEKLQDQDNEQLDMILDKLTSEVIKDGNK